MKKAKVAGCLMADEAETLSTVTHLAGVLNVGHLLLLEYPSVITEAGSRKFNVV